MTYKKTKLITKQNTTTHQANYLPKQKQGQRTCVGNLINFIDKHSGTSTRAI